MRFLIVTQYFPPEIGAPQVRLASLAKTLLAKGHSVEVITGMPNHPTGRIFSEYRRHFYKAEYWNGCRVYRIWLYAALGTGFKRILNYFSFALFSIIPLLRASRPEVIFVESPPPFVMVPAVFINFFWRAKLVLNVADLWPDSVVQMGVMRDGFLIKVFKLFERWCYRRAHAVNAVTQGIRNILIVDKNVSSSKVLFFPNGADTETFRPRESDQALADQLDLAGKSVILYAGTLGYAQGLEVALQAMASVREAMPEVCLVLIGDGSARSELVRFAQNLALTNVRFLPPNTPDYVAQLYSLAKAGLATLKPLPLFEGARPSKVFPIMASAKPVIYCGSGEGARLIEDACAGIVVPPGDSDGLAEAIATLIRNPEKAQRYGQNGRDYVVKNLSWGKIIDDWLAQLAVHY